MFLGRVVAKGEPAWLEDDRAWAMALLKVEADQHKCGLPLSETLDPANGEAYTVDVLGQCAACYALETASDGMPEGMLYNVRRRSVGRGSDLDEQSVHADHDQRTAH